MMGFPENEGKVEEYEKLHVSIGLRNQTSSQGKSLQIYGRS